VPRATPFLVTILGASLSVIGCSSTPDTILESDVPLPPGLAVRASSDVARSEGQLSGGFFLLYGEIDDPVRLGAETRERFLNAGWQGIVTYESPHLVRLAFTKGRREAKVELVSRRIDPMMSSGSVRLAESVPAGSPTAAADER
jgi:hypothetical protein